MTKTLPLNPQPYRDDLETIENDEPETARALAETMLSISRKTFEDGGHAIRSVHAKSHGLLEGEFRVLDGLPPELAQGLFAKPATYKAFARLSTTPGDILHDSVSTPRGLSLKIVDVEGERLNPDEDSASQDFLMVNGKQFNASSAKAFLLNLKGLALTTDHADGLKEVASKVLRGIESVIEAVGSKSAAIISLGGHPETNILGESFFAQLPLRYGGYVAKFALVPQSPELKALTGQELDLNHNPDGLREAVADYFRHNTAVWEFQVQLCSSAADMSIEDAASVWDEDKSPFITVALLTVAPQPSWNAERDREINDGMSFRPWNGLAAHRPLGSIMRMRKLAYARSAAFRSERNETPVEEPTEKVLSA
jgi:hypothetical protein